VDDAARAGWLYYVGGNTQEEIAAKLGISRQSAQRLVSLAVSEGLIKVRLDHPIGRCMDIATQLRARFALDPAGWQALRETGWPELSERERRSVADNVEVGFRAGEIGAAGAFAGMDTLAQDPDRQVARAPIALLSLAEEDLLPPGLRATARAYGASLYRERLARLGWDAAPGEPGDDKLLRQALIDYLALGARDAGVRREADRRGRRFAGLDGAAPENGALDPELIETALAVVVQEGGAPTFDALIERFRASDDTRWRRHLLRALASTRDPALSARARALALDGALHPREVWTPLYTQSRDRETRADTWSYVETHFDALVERAGSTYSGWMPWLAASFCDAERIPAVESFLQPRIHRIAGGPRNLAASLESIRLCAALVDAQQPGAVRFFQAVAAGASPPVGNNRGVAVGSAALQSARPPMQTRSSGRMAADRP